jgi:hypothetical protein
VNIAEFKQAAGAFVGRDPEYFLLNADGSQGADKLLIAVNNAKAFLQRQIDFEYARTWVDLTYITEIGAGEGIRLQDAVRQYTSCPVNVKKVINLFTPHGYARLLPLRQKTFRGVTEMVRGSFERNGDLWMPDCRESYAQYAPCGQHNVWTAVWGHTFRDPIYYQHGRTLYMYPKPNGFDQQQQNSPAVPNLPFVADVVEFLPPYENAASGLESNLSGVEGKPACPYITDFILDMCYDYMLWRTIVELNVFLKDDDQVGVSQTKMTEALENIRQWNADLINAGYEIE